MKTVKFLYIVAFVAFLLMMISCGDNGARTPAVKNGTAPSSFVIDGTVLKDTVNKTDANGLKQGHWIVREVKAFQTQPHNYTKSAPGKPDTIIQKSMTFTERVKLEEGFYIDDKKVGYWKYFYPEGGLKDSILFENGVAKAK